MNRTFFLFVFGLSVGLFTACGATSISPQGDGKTPDLSGADVSTDALALDDLVNPDVQSTPDTAQDSVMGEDSLAVEDGTLDLQSPGDVVAVEDQITPPVDTGGDVSVDMGAVDTAQDSQGPQPGNCEALRAALQSELYAKIQSCTVVLRLNYNTHALIAHQVICGSYGPVDEASARETAQADAGYGEMAQLISSSSPEDFYVFRQMLGDFGGTAAVSAKTGKTVFGGSIIWSGTGEITHPTSWRDPAELGQGCGLNDSIPIVQGYDLVQSEALGAQDLQDAMNVVGQTVVIPAFQQGGYIFNAIVMLYPRSVGLFNPETAEWIVLVQGGWLD